MRWQILFNVNTLNLLVDTQNRVDLSLIMSIELLHNIWHGFLFFSIVKRFEKNLLFFSEMF
jgi:hypothetical protein